MYLYTVLSAWKNGLNVFYNEKVIPFMFGSATNNFLLIELTNFTTILGSRVRGVGCLQSHGGVPEDIIIDNYKK